MEAFVFLWFIFVIAALIILYAIANVFYSIACMKGHNDKKYFWWCFFVPPAGYLMVVALPDRPKEEKSESLFEKVNRSEKSSSGQTVDHSDVSDDSWEELPKSCERPAEQDGKMKCPVCGTVQNADRKVCWKCGVRFEVKE